MIERIGTAVYAACVDFMIRSANAFGVTYRDANAFMFFVLWPCVTVGLVLWRIAQRRERSRLQQAIDARGRPTREGITGTGAATGAPPRAQ